MEEKPAPEQEEQPKEKMISKSSLMIVAAFLLLQVVVLTLVFWSRLFGGGTGQVEVADSGNDLAQIALVSLGRFEITKPNDPLQQSFTRCRVTIDLQVQAERAAEVGATISKLEGKFREIARQAFLDADSRDLATENLANVKSAIKNRTNQMFGEEVIMDVIFGDFRAI